MNEQKKATRYALDIDGSMEPWEDGSWVTYNDYNQLRQRFAEVESQLSDAISLLGEVREDGNYYLLGEIKDAVAAFDAAIASQGE